MAIVTHYQYTWNAPTRFIDPSGKYSVGAGWMNRKVTQRLHRVATMARKRIVSEENKIAPRLSRSPLASNTRPPLTITNLLQYLTPENDPVWELARKQTRMVEPGVEAEQALPMGFAFPTINMVDPEASGWKKPKTTLAQTIGREVITDVFLNGDIFPFSRKAGDDVWAATLVHEVAHWHNWEHTKDRSVPFGEVTKRSGMTMLAPNEPKGYENWAEGWYLEYLVYPEFVDVKEKVLRELKDPFGNVIMRELEVTFTSKP